MKTKKDAPKNQNSFTNGISVIIPTFNRIKYLYSTLLCLLNQSICNKYQFEYEIIIIDSGNDDTKSLIRQLQTIYTTTIIYKKISNTHNRSLLRNQGASLAKYKYLCFLDNDMLVPPNFIQSHYLKHLTTENLVLIGLRRFLTEFDINLYGENTLLDDFYKLSQLPSYKEVYNDGNLEIQPWRFVYSHSFSLDKKVFQQTGGFNIEFGNNWGLEDLELGYRLQNLDCKFELLTEILSYHQPHFNQSIVEQPNSLTNAKLFFKLHNCFEIEIYNKLYYNFEFYYNQLIELSKEFIPPTVEILKEFNLIFGCIFDSSLNLQFNNMQLGCFSFFDDNSIKKILILQMFFKFDKSIQITILLEAFRISKYIYFEELSLQQSEYILSLCKSIGIIAKIKIQKNYSIFQKIDYTSSDCYIFLLPDLFQPEKRYVYSCLANSLLKQKKYICIRDEKNAKSLTNEDFSLPFKEAENLIRTKDNSVNSATIHYIASSSMILSDFDNILPKTNQSYIFNDDDFLLNNDYIRNKKLYFYKQLDKTDFSMLSFLSVFDNTQKYICKNKNSKIKDKHQFCVFMENGFKEDGIDLVLIAFNNYIKKNHSSNKLIIKMPDYDILGNDAFPAHNEQSKINKLFAVKQKFQIDRSNLLDTINKLRLNKYVKLQQSNMNIENIIKLIDSSELLIHVGRNYCIGPQVYIALLLKKDVILAKHQQSYMLKELADLCTFINSKEFSFAQEMNLPLSSYNINYIASRINQNELEDAFNKDMPLNKNIINFSKLKDKLEQSIKLIFEEF